MGVVPDLLFKVGVMGRSGISLEDFARAKEQMEMPPSETDGLWNRIALIEAQLGAAVRHIDSIQGRLSKLEAERRK